MAERVDIEIDLLDNISKQLNTLNGKFDELDGKVKKVDGSLLNMSSAMNVISGLWDVAKSTVGQIVEIGGEAEQTSVAFSTLIGNEQEAADVLGQIHDYAQKTPFTQLQLEDAAKTMLNFGIKTQDVNKDLQMLGDISMGDANKMNSLSLVFGQVASAGKMQGQDLMQFINQGFNPLKELADMTGMSYKDLQDAMGKGAISFEMVQQAIQHATGEGGKFHDMANKLSGTFQGRLSTVIGKFQDTAINIFNEIKPTLMDLLSTLESMAKPIEAIGKKLVDWAPLILTVVSAITAYNIATKAYATYTAIASTLTEGMTLAQWALNVALDANPVGAVVAGIVLLIGMVTTIIIKYKEWGAMISMVLGPLGMIVNLIMEFKSNWDMITSAFKNGGFLEGIIAIGKTMRNAVIRPIAQLFDTLGLTSISEKLNKLIWEPTEKAKQATTNTTVTAQPEQTKDLALANQIQNAANAGGKKGSTKAGAKTKASAEATATGGTRNTSITINFDKEMVSMNFNGGYLDNRKQVEKTLEESLLRVLNSAKAAI